MPPGDQASPNELGATFAAQSWRILGASSRVPRLSLVPSFSRTRSGCGGCGAKNASHQFAAFGGGAVVVPGVRAAAGKAVSSQSSLGTRIFSSPLVDCNWLRLRRCESLCFYAALMSLHDFLGRTPHPACGAADSRPPFGRPVCVLCFVRKRDPWRFCVFASASRAKPPHAVGAAFRLLPSCTRTIKAQRPALDSPQGPASNRSFLRRLKCR